MSLTLPAEEDRRDSAGVARSMLRELGLLLLFCALAAIMTWPLVPNIDRAVTDPGDPLFSTWVLDWVAHAIRTGAPLWDANIFHPAKASLAFSENTVGIAAPMLPLFAAGVAPLTIHNIALLLGFALSGYAACLAARKVTGSIAAGIIGGIAFAFTGFRFHHLPHIHYVWGVWMPLMFLGTLAYAARPTWTRALLLAAVTVMNGLVSLTWFVFATPAVVLTAMFLGASRERVRDFRYWMRLAVAILLATGAMLPVLLPYRTIAREYGMVRSPEELIGNGAEWQDWLTPNLQNRNYGHLSPRASYSHERTLFPGFAILSLCLLALLGKRQGQSGTDGGESHVSRHRAMLLVDAALVVASIGAWVGWIAGRIHIGKFSATGPRSFLLVAAILLALRFWLWVRTRLSGTRTSSAPPLPDGIRAALLWIAIGALGARGLNGVLYSFLFEHVEAFRGMRMPIRWVMVSWVGIAVLAAAGMLVLLRGRSSVSRAAITVAVAAAMLFELRAAPVRYFVMPLESRPVYEWIRDTPITGGILELPMTQSFAYEYAWRSTVHHKPLLNGVSSFLPPSYVDFQSQMDEETIPDSLFDRLERDACSLVVVHERLHVRRAAIRDWVRRGLDAGRLVFLRHFDEGDIVFALSRVEPRAAEWRAPEIPDPAGTTPSRHLVRFLEGGEFYPTGTTTVMLDKAPFGILRGPQEFAGWIYSPAGVREVWFRFGGGIARVPAALHERGDVQQKFSWAPPKTIRGFRAVAERPWMLHGETDFQVEVIDGNGRRHLNGPMFFEWRNVVPVTFSWEPQRLAALLQRLGADPGTAVTRVMTGTAAVSDFTRDLAGDPLHEGDAVFAARVLPILLGGPPPSNLTSRVGSLLESGVPRERVIDIVLESREFREAYGLR